MRYTIRPAVAADTHTPPRPRSWRGAEGQPFAIQKMLAAVPLLAILGMQVVLSARLLRISAASGDESLYIYAGHQEIYELFHGGGSPYYDDWFSGSPVIYPLLAAMADHIGGLVLAREMSMAFMLTATALLYATTRRFFGYWPAVAAAGLFTALGVTQGLGALATFDAMSLALMAFGAYCAVRAGDGGARWLLVVPLALLAANATSYATVLFDPVVIGLAALMLRGDGWRRMLQRAASLTAAIVIALVVTVALAGTAYIHGAAFTTFGRSGGLAGEVFGWPAATPSQVAQLSWSALGLIVCLGFAALAVALLLERHRSLLPLLAFLAVAGTLVTIENMRIRSAISLAKHDDFGAWFACIAAGYALGRAAELAPTWYGKVPVIGMSLATAVFAGAMYADQANISDGITSASLRVHVHQEQADMAAKLRLFSDLKPYLQLGPEGRYLLAGTINTQLIYDEHLNVHWWQYANDSYIKYPVPGLGGNAAGTSKGVYMYGPPGYSAAIRAHWFALISMIGNYHNANDAAILAAVKSTPGYVLLTTRGGAPTYIWAPDYPARERPDSPRCCARPPPGPRNTTAAVDLSIQIFPNVPWRLSHPGVVRTASPGLVSVGRYLMSRGYSKAAAAGAAGLVGGEAGPSGSPESVGSGGYGLIGWTPPFYPYEYAAGAVPPWPTGNVGADMAAQLEAMYNWMQVNGWPAPQNRWPNTAAGALQAAYSASAAYERPAVTGSDVHAFLVYGVFNHLATGGRAPAGSMAWVGERGPDLLPGAMADAVAFTALITIGTGLITRQLKNASATYGAFGTVIGIVALLLLAKLSLYAATTRRSASASGTAPPTRPHPTPPGMPALTARPTRHHNEKPARAGSQVRRRPPG
jgi:Phage tail lysozyme/Dolichyl-phosphate-mannose-protein mannosyltransferase